jgi:hypothetical protein
VLNKGRSSNSSKALVTGCRGIRTPTVFRALQLFDFVFGSCKHSFGSSLDAFNTNVYGPGRHFFAILNASVRPGTTFCGKPCVYLSMSANPLQRIDIGFEDDAPGTITAESVSRS